MNNLCECRTTIFWVPANQSDTKGSLYVTVVHPSDVLCWRINKGVAVVEWLSSWLAEQEVRGSIPSLTT